MKNLGKKLEQGKPTTSDLFIYPEKDSKTNEQRFNDMTIKDMTSWKEIQSEIHKQELIYRAMIEASPLAYFVVNSRTDEIIDFNSLFCDIWGIKHLETAMKLGVLKNNDIIPYCLPLIADVPAFTKSCKALQDESNRSVVEDEILFTDGRMIRRFFSQIRDEEDICFGRLYIFEDITHRKEIEKLHLESVKRLKEFAQAVPDASFIIDEDGRYIEISGDYQKFISVPIDQLLGKTIEEIVPSETSAILLNEVKQSITNNESRYRVDQVKLGDKNIWIEGRIVPMSYFVNNKRIVAIVLRDITQQREVESMLQFNYELGQKSDFFNDMIDGKILINEKITVDAKTLGIDLSLPLICCILSLEKINNEKQMVHCNSINAQIAKKDLIRLLTRLPQCTVWENRENIVIVCHDTTNDGAELITKIKEKVFSYHHNIIMAIGVSDVHRGFDSLEISYQEAESALMAIQCDDKEGIYYYRDIGLFQLLSCMVGNKLALNYIYRTIEPLVTYDLEKGTELLKTLEEILYNNSLKETAEKMFLHRKTLVFRKKRIEKILGVSLERFETRLSLATAIKLYKLRNFFR